MSRLYGVNVDTNKYRVDEIDNNNYYSYKITEKKYHDSYLFIHIIGIEQISFNEFLIYKKSRGDNFMLKRVRLVDSAIVTLFEKEFNNIIFLNDDRILFTYNDSSARDRSSGIYSIKNNKYVEEGKWLDGKVIDVYKDDNNESILYVEEELSSIILNNPRLIYTVNPNTLEPNSPIFSELRDSFIEVETNKDIDYIKERDISYISNIEEHYYEEKRNRLKKVKSRILKKESE